MSREFKVGDKVRVRKDLKAGKQYNSEVFTTEMEQYKGTIQTIAKVSDYAEKFILDGRENWVFTPEMLGLVEENKTFNGYDVDEISKTCFVDGGHHFNFTEEMFEPEMTKPLKFKAGDRVQYIGNVGKEDNTLYNQPGTVLGLLNGCKESYAVKFDNWRGGHAGLTYYDSEGLNFDPYDHSHLYCLVSELKLVEEEPQKSKQDKFIETLIKGFIGEDIIGRNRFTCWRNRIAFKSQDDTFAFWSLVEAGEAYGITEQQLFDEFMRQTIRKGK